MRILYLTPGCFDKGGISRYCRYQIQALRELYGSENIKVLSLTGPDAHGFEVPFRVDWHGSAVNSVVNKIRFSIKFFWLAITARPQIIHVAHVHLSPLAVWIAKLCAARTILNVYGLEIWSGLSWARRRSVRSIDKIIADCHFTADYVRKAALHVQSPSVIWDCVDLERFTPGQCPDAVLKKYGIASKDSVFVILSLGRLSKGAAHKGYDRLIRAFSILFGRQGNAELVIAGSGDNRPNLEQLAESLGVAQKVKFIGSVDERDLANVYRAASVFSLVSDYGVGRGEGIPLTPLEAMACGIPIIVGNRDGSQEAIVDNANGFAIDPFNEAAHVGLLGQIKQSGELADRLGAGARSVAVQKFGYERFRNENSLVYQGLAAETIVIHRLGSLGDTIVALPCFHKIARSFPNARRIVVTNFPTSTKSPSLENILSQSGLIHGVISYPTGMRSIVSLWQLFSQIRATGAKTLIYFPASRNRLSMIRDMAFFRFCGIKKVIGFSLNFGRYDLRVDPQTGFTEREVERLARGISTLGPIDLTDPELWDLRLTDEEIEAGHRFLTSIRGRLFIVINCGGKVKINDWGDANWRLFLSSLSAEYPELATVFVGSADERSRFDQLAQAWRGPALNGAGILSPRECASVMDHAELFVGHDSGPMHLAANRGTRCVAIFGENNPPRRWHPWGLGHRVIHNMDGVLAISPEDVLRETRDLLATKSPQHSPAYAYQ